MGTSDHVKHTANDECRPGLTSLKEERGALNGPGVYVCRSGPAIHRHTHTHTRTHTHTHAHTHMGRRLTMAQLAQWVAHTVALCWTVMWRPIQGYLTGLFNHWTRWSFFLNWSTSYRLIDAELATCSYLKLFHNETCYFVHLFRWTFDWG